MIENRSEDPYTIYRGYRVGQLVILPLFSESMTENINKEPKQENLQQSSIINGSGIRV
jgi:dUTPase